MSLTFANAATVYSWITETNCIDLELVDPEDGQNEKEESKEEYTNEQYLTALTALNSNAGLLSAHLFFTSRLSSCHHPEILTPPPRRSGFHF